MIQYRVTKYNPKYRDSNGHYHNDEWTSFSCVGEEVALEEYLKVENSYIQSAVNFLENTSVEAAIPGAT